MAAAAAAGRRRRARSVPAVAGRLLTADAGLAIGVALTLCVLAFWAQGGVAIEPMTWSEVGLVLGGAAIGALALAGPARHAAVARWHGAPALFGLAALAALTAASVAWSLAPADSWLDANRMLAWLGAFAAGWGLARLLPGRWGALLGGLALGSVVVCGWALLTKSFPEAFAETEIFARLRAPFGYWNSVGLMAAIGIPPLLWLAARRSGHAAVGALAWPALGLLIVCLLLAYSRGALLALVGGLAFWFAVVPLRLRGALVLLVTGLVGALVTAWAFAQDGLTKDRLPVVARADAGHELFVLLLLMVVVLLAAGLVAGFVGSYRPPSARARMLFARGLAAAAALAVFTGLAGLALSERGIGGTISEAWTGLTDPEARTPGNTPDRLTATSSVRARYWAEALDIHAEHPGLGAGAAAYATARKRYRTSDIDVQHAHGYVVQTLADLGWAGLMVSLAGLAAFVAAAAAALGLRRRDRGLPWDAERVGMATLAAVVIAFGLHSLIDWTWYVPANAVAALVAAGWLAGRGPLRDRQAAPVAGEHDHFPLRARLRAWRPEPYRTSAAAAVLIVAMAAAWTIVQPLRAVHAGDAAIERFQNGAYAAAADIARIGTERNPLSVEPLFELAAIEAAAGRPDRAEDALERAVRLQPANAEAWRRLGRFRLAGLNRPDTAQPALRAAYYLDPQSPDTASDLLEVNRRLAGAP